MDAMEPKALVKDINLISPSFLYKKEAQLTTSSSRTATRISKVTPPQIDLWQLLNENLVVPSTSVRNIFGYRL